MLKSFYETHSLADAGFPIIFHYDIMSMHTPFLAHWHENIKIIYCTDGEMLINSDLEAYTVKKGEIAIINSGMVHTFISTNVTCGYYCLIIDISLCDMYGIDISETKFNQVIKNEDSIKIFDEIVQELSERRVKYKTAVVALCLKLLTEFCRYEIKEHIKNNFANLKAINMVKIAINYIKSNFENKITVSDICTHTGYSKYHFCGTFHEITEKTVVEYINLVRCLNAKKIAFLRCK